MSTPIIEPPDTEDIFRNLMRHTTIGSTAAIESEIHALVAEWLGTDPANLPGHGDMYWDLTQINLQAAINSFLAEPGRESRIVGVQTPSADHYQQIPFSRLLSPLSFKWGGASIGVVEYQLRPCGYGKSMRCIDRGLVLFRDADGAGAIWIRHTSKQPASIEVLTSRPARAAELIDELRILSDKVSPYHNEMFRVRLEGSDPVVDFMHRPEPMTADDIIMPEGVLETIDQHTIAVAKRRKRLKKLGMHLKRGILLHGPPGTGKTHTVRYLASNLRKSTVVVLPKQAIGIAHQLLPFLEPAMIVLDDVDLVAENRSLPGLTERTRLFEVLEALDGLQGTADVLFVLTTNRIETMEPAIAARPGRVDQAIEIPRPDADCRRRLFALYTRGIDLQATSEEIDKILDRTDGVSASFIKELLRRSTVKASKRGGKRPGSKIVVPADVVMESLDQMLDPTNPMTRLLLGADAVHPDLAVTVVDQR